MTLRTALLLTCAVTAPLMASVPSSVPAWLEPSRDGKAFVSRMAEGSLLWTGSSAVLQFDGSPEQKAVQIEWKLRGANAAPALQGVERLESRSNYVQGRNRQNWRMGVPHYGKALARAVYPGIDVVWYAQGRMLEYDFIVAPGADPSPIAMTFDGASRPSITPEGDLLLNAGGMTIRQHKPVVTQNIGGRTVNVDARYQIAKNGEVRFALGDYDRRHELVIDPVFSYAGFIGGTRLDVANGIALDSTGALWITGSSQSELSLPEDMPSFQKTKKGRRDAFLARVLPGENGGGRIDYWTYFGGDSDDEATAIAIDKQDMVYLTGNTTSTNFPLGGDAFQTTLNETNADAFVIKFDPKIFNEFALLYSSYYGGTGSEAPQAIAVRDDGYIAIVGHTASGELPKMSENPIQPGNRGGVEAFLAVFNPLAGSANATLYRSSFYGGASTDVANAVAWDKQGRLVLAGSTMSEDFPIEGPSYQSSLRGGDAFIVVLDFTKTGLDQIIYGTYLGGYKLDVATAMQIDANGLIWLTGYTISPDFPVTPGAPQLGLEGVSDAFVTAVDITKAGVDAIKYSTYFGGSGAEVAYGIVLEPRGAVTIAGYSNSMIFPTKYPFFVTPDHVRQTDAFYASFNPAVTGADGLLWAQQHGGSGTDVATSIATDAHGNLAVAGFTSSPDLPTAAPTGKQNPVGLYTGWFMRLNADPR